MDAVSRLLEDAPISSSKRQKIDAAIREELEIDSSVGPRALFQLLREEDLVAWPFIDLWNIILVFPDLAPILWNDDHFKRRMEFEFNDVYRDSVDQTTGNIQEAIQEILKMHSTKSTTRIYPPNTDSFLPWAILYQRCKRMLVLTKKLNNTQLDVVISQLTPALRDLVAFKPYGVRYAAHDHLVANGPFIAMPVVVVASNHITAFLITSWTGSLGNVSKHLNSEKVSLFRSPGRNYKDTFTITQTGILVYLIEIPVPDPEQLPFDYIEIYDSVTGRRLPGADRALIQRARIFYVKVLQAGHSTFRSITSPSLSSTILLRVSEDNSPRVFNVENYIAYLETGQDPRPGMSGFGGDLSLQNNWQVVFRSRRWPDKPLFSVMKDGIKSFGMVPLEIWSVLAVRGPFFSVSRRQPIEIFQVLEKRISARFFPVGETESKLNVTLPFESWRQSSIYVVSKTLPHGLLIHHPAGYEMNIQFTADWLPYEFPELISLVGTKVLLRSVNQDNHEDSRYYILDLEELFLANLPGVPGLIRAPCRTCSVPSLARCAGPGCRMPYCGTDCQKADWENHRTQCAT